MTGKNTPDDISLIENRIFIDRLKLGDEDCFEMLNQIYSSRIYNLVYRMLGTEAEAGDIVRDSFSQVYFHINF